MAGSLQSMCGRFTQRFSWREVHTFLRLGTAAPALNLRPRYNLALSQNAAVARDEDGAFIEIARPRRASVVVNAPHPALP